jgi:hypothetical protein
VSVGRRGWWKKGYSHPAQWWPQKHKKFQITFSSLLLKVKRLNIKQVLPLVVFATGGCLFVVFVSAYLRGVAPKRNLTKTLPFAAGAIPLTMWQVF